MSSEIPASYIFSYWIFIWSVIYIILVYTLFQKSLLQSASLLQWANPTLILLVAFIWTTESLIRLYIQSSKWQIIAKYAATIIAIKAIPLFLIYRLGLPYGWNINTFRDASVALGVFLLYNFYLWINGTDYETVYTDLTKSIENDENRTPFESIVNKLFSI